MVIEEKHIGPVLIAASTKLFKEHGIKSSVHTSKGGTPYSGVRLDNGTLKKFRVVIYRAAHPYGYIFRIGAKGQRSRDITTSGHDLETLTAAVVEAVAAFPERPAILKETEVEGAPLG